MSKQIKPWEDPSTPWKTKSSFFSWLRGGLRRAVWKNHPVKLNLLKTLRYKAPVGRFNKMVFVADCDICKKQHKLNNIEVDHLVPSGSLKEVEDVSPFVHRLAFIDETVLRLLCKDCHRAITYADKKGITFEEAVTEKKVIAFCKQPVETQKKVLSSMGVTDVSNNIKRRSAARGLIESGELV